MGESLLFLVLSFPFRFEHLFFLHNFLLTLFDLEGSHYFVMFLKGAQATL